MKYLVICFVLYSSVSRAEFFCNEEAAQLKGNVYSACGIGDGLAEQRARTAAFNYAKEEFDKFCEASSNCRGHDVDVEPKRNVCSQDKFGTFHCYRMINFTIR